MTKENQYPVSQQGNFAISGIDSLQLAKEYGTPLYVLDESYIRDICKTYKNTMDLYGENKVLYASKALSCKALYKIVESEGLGCDVVSEGELLTALSVNFNPKNIYFHGNNKTLNEIRLAVENQVGAIVADSFTELDLIEEECIKQNTTQDILLRLNTGVEAHTHSFIQTSKVDSKFGFNVVNGDAFTFLEYALSKKHLNVLGFHSHIGSQIFEVESFVKAVDVLVNFMKDSKARYNYTTKVLDMGGGFGIKYTDDDVDLTLEDYANFVKTLCDTVATLTQQYNLEKPVLMIEPGRSIVGKAGTTLYTVGSIKEIKEVKNYIAVDGGMFDNPRCALYDSRYTTLIANKPNDKPQKTYTIAGKCCESGDIITKDCYLPIAERGDILAVLSTGAYNYSMASNYNRNGIPAMVLISPNKQTNIIVKRQTVEQIMQNDLVPDYLK